MKHSQVSRPNKEPLSPHLHPTLVTLKQHPHPCSSLKPSPPSPVRSQLKPHAARHFQWQSQEEPSDCNSCLASLNQESVNQRFEELKETFPQLVTAGSIGDNQKEATIQEHAQQAGDESQ